MNIYKSNFHTRQKRQHQHMLTEYDGEKRCVRSTALKTSWYISFSEQLRGHRIQRRWHYETTDAMLHCSFGKGWVSALYFKFVLTSEPSLKALWNIASDQSLPVQTHLISVRWSNMSNTWSKWKLPSLCITFSFRIKQTDHFLLISSRSHGENWVSSCKGAS